MSEPQQLDTEGRDRGGGASSLVLVVEDEPTVREIVVEALTLVGFEVVGAGDIADALRVVDRVGDRLDAVVADTHLPDGGATELLAELLRSRPRLGVVLMSGSPADEAAETASLDRYPFLVKPFPLDALVRAVRGAVEKARASS